MTSTENFDGPVSALIDLDHVRYERLLAGLLDAVYDGGRPSETWIVGDAEVMERRMRQALATAGIRSKLPKPEVGLTPQAREALIKAMAEAYVGGAVIDGADDSVRRQMAEILNRHLAVTHVKQP